MALLVPFDGSALATTALARAVELGDCRDEDVVVASVVPGSQDYARRHGWVESGEPFDQEETVDWLGRQVQEIAPDAEFRSQQVSARVDHADIARRLRSIARDVSASVVYLGSENVGRIAKPISSIGSNVAARTDYDIYLVQRPDPEFE